MASWHSQPGYGSTALLPATFPGHHSVSEHMHSAAAPSRTSSTLQGNKMLLFSKTLKAPDLNSKIIVNF